MGAGIFNIVLGVLGIVGGLSGKFTLLGTNSPTALAVFGGAIAAYGAFQLLRSTKR